MSVTNKRSTWVLAGMLWALASGTPSLADDTELFVSSANAFPNARPNVLFIMDTSGSMNNQVITQTTYDVGISYPGSCDPDRVYWRRGTGSPPDCDDDEWFDRSEFYCNAAIQAFNASTGSYIDRMAQYDDDDERWERLDEDEKDWPVECEDDGGIHGDGSGTNELYAQDDDEDELWSSDPNDEIAWEHSTPIEHFWGRGDLDPYPGG